ncbi:LanC like 1 L homeolog [Xenopus laevis]|uniref:Glutathione S-transferase LANCL1 n=1 Tax=Xenopus laevis TaxID=8355 RepID=Q7ZSZ1_XENLA|nr:LanC like glutathione S-transferase 1 L homeolog [Xenopus laevis]AAH44978.1 MGC52973 protein [Xenopus laevis]AAH51600.1 MGC52973 protein [Xenopus laevis]
MEQRCFQNPYPDYNHQASTAFNSTGQLTFEFVHCLNNKIKELLQAMEKGLKSADPGDCTVYTGWAGIALLYLHLSDVYGDSSLLQKAHEYICKSLRCLTRRDVTFLCGDAGPYAVGAVVFQKLGLTKEAEDCVKSLLQLHPSVVRPDSGLPDELLYGRMGYLYSLLFVNKQFGEEKIPSSYIQQVCSTVLESGERLAGRRNLQSQSPLMHEWYREYYVGPAHGLAGIYYFLMQPECNVSCEKLQNLVRPSMEYVRCLKFPTGNFPPCIGDRRDLLVHWCHGAPGVIYMLIQAYKVFGEPQYLVDALQCAEVAWHYGLLKKGYGLCHGAAGNAYSFLALYNQTQDVKFLYRACKFAEWCMDYGTHGCRTADTPYSLFEGMAGTIYFLSDLLEPTKAKFPSFEM